MPGDPSNITNPTSIMWHKQGRIFQNEQQAPWMASHACVPTAYALDSDTIRIFYAPRNARGQSIPTFIDVAADDPSQVRYVHTAPVLELGELGTFDDGGIMPCCVVPVGEQLYLYYVGWNPSGSVPYRNAVGLAISDDQGRTFYRPNPGAVVDRNRKEPFFTASPWVMRERDDLWHMWYASGTGFVENEIGISPLYVIKYAHSRDGIAWQRPNYTCILPDHDQEANARATVVKDGDLYKMWYCYRGSRDFRDGADAYRIGYAESSNAIDWQRMDARAGISYASAGWDSTMQTYPSVLDHGGRRYLFYNGNGFGRTGIGYAVWQ